MTRQKLTIFFGSKREEDFMSGMCQFYALPEYALDGPREAGA